MNNFKRFLSLALAVLMTLSYAPTIAYGIELEQANDALIEYIEPVEGLENIGTEIPEVNEEGGLTTEKVEKPDDAVNPLAVFAVYVETYDELVQYLADADYPIVALSKDISTLNLVTGVYETISIPEDVTKTLKLNGKTLTGSILAKNANLTIEGGSIVNNDGNVSAVEINAGTLELTNVNIESARHAVRIDGPVTATINGGEYKLIPAAKRTHHAVNISGAANVTIEDGTFVGPKESVSDSGSAVCVQSGATATIEGGDFSGGKNSTLGISGSVTIKGGNFDQMPEINWVAENAEFYFNGEKYIENNGRLLKVTDIVASIGEVKYTSLQEAVNAATENATITLLNNVTLADTLTVPEGKAITLDLTNGRELKVDTINIGIGNTIAVGADSTINAKAINGEGTLKVDVGATIKGTVSDSIHVEIYSNSEIVEDAYLEDGVVKYSVASIRVDNITTYYKTLKDAIDAAQPGEEIVLLADLEDVDETISKNIVLNLGGKTITDAYIIVTGDVTIKNGKIKNVDEPYPLVVQNGGKLTIEDVAIEASKSDRAIWVRSGSKLIFNSGSILATKGANNTKTNLIAAIYTDSNTDVTINGGTITVDTPNNKAVGIFGNYNNANVTVNGGKISTSGKNYSYGINVDGDITVNGGEIVTNEKGYGYSSGIRYGNNYALVSATGDVTITGGTITTNGYSGYIVNVGRTYSSNDQTVTITGGTFINDLSEVEQTSGGHNAPAFLWEGSASDVTATISDGDFSGFSADILRGENTELEISGGTFDVAVNEEYLAEGFKVEQNADDTYGVVEKPDVADVNGVRYKDLNKALNAAVTAGDSVTVTLLDNIDLTGQTWTPVYFNSYIAAGANTLILDGKNYTITGLSDMLFSGVWTGTKLEVKDLTIDEADIKHDVDDTSGTIGVGAIVGNVSAIKELVLNNVKLTDSHVEGGHWTGGFIGYAAGYSGNDGPVFTTITIENCSVTGSTISGKGSVGGIVGHATGDAWTSFAVEGSTITGNTITSTGSSTNKAGIVMGTIGAAGTAQTTNDTTLTGGVFVAVTESSNTAESNGTTITTVYGRQGSPTGKLEITGGTYEHNPIEENVTYAAPKKGFIIEENADGTFGLQTEPPKGRDFTGYTREDAIWGETWGNATESFVIKVLDTNGDVMGTSTLNNIDGIIDGDVEVTWSLKLDAASNTDGYWTMEWTTAPTIDNMPAKVELWVDGVKVSGGDVVLNAPDDLSKLYAAAVDADGKILKYYTTVKAAIEENNHVAIIREGNYPVPSMKAGLTLEGVDNVVLEGYLSGTLENLTLKNLYIKGANAQRWAYAKGDLRFENVTFHATGVYALHFDGITEGATLLYKDCTIIGWAAMSGSPASCEFNGCTFKDNGTYGVIRTYFDATIENCTFDVDDANPNDVYQDGIHAVDGAEVTVTNCINANGDMEDLLNFSGTSTIVLDGKTHQNVAKNGDTYYADLHKALSEANNGETVKLLADVDLKGEEWTPVNFNGIFDGNNHTISNLVVNGGSNSNQGLFGTTQNGEIKNLTINNAKVTGRLNVGVVAGQPYTSKYTNIKVTGRVEVNGMAYVGGVGGKNAYANWTDITVDVDSDSYVKATSTESGTAYRTYVGGVVGFNGEGGHTFKNISSNIKVIGDVCDIGGLFGIAHYGNKFENVTFTGFVEALAGAEEVGGIAGVWHNQKGQTVTFTNVTSDGTVTVGGVDVTDDNAVVGGAYNADNYTSENSGSLLIDGKEAWLAVAEIGETKYLTLAEAFAAAQAGEEIVLLADVTETVTAPAGITLNGNGKTIDGTLTAGGDLTFKGATTVKGFSAGYYNHVITIGEGASLKVTGSRMTVSYGNTFNITGSITDAKNVDKITITPSLELVGGISFNGNGGGVNFNVTNAYVKLGDSTTKHDGATGEFNMNFNNSIVDFTKTLKTYMPTASGLAPEFNMTAKDSVIDVASHLEFWLDKTTITLDNTNLTVGGSFANAGTINVTNDANLVVEAPIMSSHGGNTGSINVTGGTFELKDSNQDWENAGTITVNAAAGLLKINDFKCVAEGKIVVDAKGFASLERVVIETTDAENEILAVEVINNNGRVSVEVEDGKIVAKQSAVAKVGNNEYATIDAAIEAWTNGTTLTLLADVTLNDVIVLKSTEMHTLDLGTYTMTAASGKNAIEITCDGRGSASYALTVNADAENPGGITATGKACIYYRKTASTKDRPIIVINNGVFNGSYSINSSSSNGGTNCPQYWINGGTFNAYMNLTKAMLITRGGYFNCSINCTGDVSAYRQISGGTFKNWQFMTAGPSGSEYKFNVGSAKNIFDIGVYVDDEGYLVVGGPIVTEPGTKFEASSTNYGGWSSYLQYSSAKDNGLYYTSAEEALADNNKTTGAVSIYTDELDLTNLNYKGTLIIKDELTVTFAEGNEPKIGSANGEIFSKVESTEDGKVTKTYWVGIAVAQIGEVKYENFEDAIAAAVTDPTITEIKVLCDYTHTNIKNTSEYYDIAQKLTITADKKVTVSGAGFAIRVMGNGAELTIDENVTIEELDVVANGFATTGENMNINGTLKALSLKQWTNNGIITVSETGSVWLGYGDGQFDMAYGNGTVTVTGNGDKTAAQFKAGYSGTRGNGNTLNLKDTYFEGGAWFNLNGSNGTFNVDNSILKVSGGDGAGSMTISSSGNKINLTNGSELVVANITLGAGNTIELDATSEIKATKLSGAGTIEIDVTGLKAGDTVDAITGDVSGFTGEIKVSSPELRAEIVDGKIVLTANVARIGETYYATLKEAVAAVKESETITILAGTISEGTIKLPATLKNVTIKGAENHASILKDMTITASDGNSIVYEGLTFDGIVFDNSRISITGWRTGEVSVKDLTVTNCEFKNLNDTTNSAPLHINMAATEPVENLTFTDNVIDGATGGSKSGVYAQVTGKTTFTGNTINNVSFRPYVIQITTDDGIADEFIVTGNTFSGSAAGRAQGLGNNASGTDTVKLVVSENIFKDITSAQQICYWNFNSETTTADLSKNYYDIDILANPSRIYYNVPAQDAEDLIEMGIFPIYADEAKTELVEAPAIMVTYPAGNPVYPDGKVEYYDNMLDAVPYTSNCPRLEGATVKLLKDIEASGIRLMENDMVLDLNDHTYTITAGTGSQGTNTSGFQIRPEVTTVATIKNGTIKVAEGAPVVWMFNVYATDFVVEDVTVDCTNMAYSYGESCYVVVSRAEDNVQFTGNTEIENFNSAVAGNAINVGDTMTIGENVNINGYTVELDAGATLTAPEGLNVVTADGYAVEYKNGVYSSVKTVATINGTPYASLDKAFAAAQNGDEVEILVAGTYALSTSGRNITITGAVDGVVFDNIGAKNMGGANVTFNNVTFDYYPNVNYTGLQHSGNLVYNNCTINGQVFLYGTSETFNKCTFNQNSADAYNVWTYGAKEVKFNECTFNSAGKSVLIYAEGAGIFNDVTVTKSTFNASSAVAGKAAIEMDSSLTAGIKLTIDADTTATGFGSGNVSGNSLWNNKKDNNTDANNDITVVVDGVTVLAPVTFVAKIGNIGYTSIADAIDAAQPGETVTILAGDYTTDISVNKDIDVVGETDANGNNLVNISGKLNVTADGATVKNLNVNNGSGNGGYINAKDVLIEGCTVVGGNGFRSCYTKGTVTFKDSTITGSTYGIHFDGSAGGNIIIDNCVITGWTSFAAAIGNVAIEDTKFAEGYYNKLRFYQNAQLTNVEFNENMSIDWGKDGVSADFVGCSVSDGSPLTDVIYLGDLVEMGIKVTENGKPVVVVASVNDVYYTSFAEAFEAAGDEDVVKIVNDLELTETIEIPADETVILDLNGKTVSMVKAEDVTANHEMIHNYGNLTIKDSATGGKLSYKYTGVNLGTTYAANTITTEPGSVLTVESGTIENLTYDSAIIAYAIDGRTNGGAGDVTVNIKGGTITSERQAVRIFANSTTNTGTLNISGGEITGRVIVQNSNTKANKAVLNVTGGTFNANAYKTDVLYVGGSNSATIDIKASVSGGTFKGEITETHVEGFITGGTYTVAPDAEFIADGYEIVYNSANKTFGVEAMDVAFVNGTDYKTLAEAIEAGKDGSIIYLKGNVTLKDTLKIPEGYKVNLDLSGKTINGAILAPNAELNIYNGSIVNNDKDVSAIEINAGKLTLTDVNIASARHAVRIDGPVTATINSGEYTLIGSNQTQHVFNVSGAANVTIKGGEFIGAGKVANTDSGAVINVKAGSTVTIEGGNFSGGKNNTLASAGTLTVTGGTYDQDPTAYVAKGYKAVEDGNKYVVTKKVPVATIGEEGYETFEEALNAVEDGETITLVEDATGSEINKEIEFTKDIEFTITGKAPEYALPVITFQNATVNIKDAEILIPELDARQNATINVVDSIVRDAGGNSIVKSYYNGAINISGTSVVYTMQVTTMGYITVSDTAELNATWQTNVYGNGMITVKGGATFATAALHLTGQDYSGRDNTDADRVGKPAQITVDGANFIVGKVLSSSGADYSYNSSHGINIGTIDGKSAVLDIKNGATVTIYMANGETANVGKDGTVNINGTVNVLCRAATGTATLVNNGSIVLKDAAATLTSNKCGKVTTDVAGYKVVYENGAYKLAAINYVAQIGEVKYESLQAAIDAAQSGDTITFLADITENVTVNKSVTIDGADFKYTGGISVTGSTTDLVVKNVNFVDYTDDYAITTNRIKSITVENCTLNGYDGFLYANKSTPTVVVKDVTMNGGIYGIHWVYGTTATLENVTMTNVTNGLLIQNYASKTINVKNCEITSINIWERSGYSGVQTFNFKGENTVGTLSTSQYAKYVLAEETATLTAPEGANVTTDVADSKVAYENGTYEVVAKDYVAQIGEVKYESLQEAINAVQNGETITLLADCDEDVTVVQAPDVAFTIDGADKTMTGTITVNGKSQAYATAGLTIKNVKFVAASGCVCINLGVNGNNNTRYTSNVTVENCTFTGTDNTSAAIKNYTGGCKNLTVKDCTATGMHSLIQVKGIDGITVSNVTVNGKNGIAVGTSTNVVIDKANITATGYGVRADGEGAYTMTVKDSTITANDPVVVRKAAGAYELTIEGTNSFVATNAKGYQVTFTAGDDGSYVAPTGEFELTGAENLKVYPTYVAQIGEVKYESLQAAIDAAQSGDTITFLADITGSVTVSKSVTIDGANFKYTGGISVSESTTDLVVKNVNFVDYTDEYAITTNRIKSITVENCTLNGYDGFLYANKSTPTVVVKDVTMNGG
ncbi:MAG: right-handed parallel beta-helix repeat-containing protein, partial [Oscillospiraceae bacterium]|nr:right-handed parallel beta-helix repeat-containing protein [Oscillospiraceae bacterium]